MRSAVRPGRNCASQLFGVKTKTEAAKIIAETAALSLISKDDPPILMSFAMAPDEAPPDKAGKAHIWKLHHVVHGIKLKQLCEELGVEAHLSHPGVQARYSDPVEFFKAKLTGK